MNKKKFFFVIALCLVTLGNGLSLEATGKPLTEDPIQVAIGKFSGKCKLYKQASAFYVKMLSPQKYPYMVVVSISKSGTKMLLKPDATIGTKGKLPFRYYERDGKLFFWKDDDFVLTEEALSVYRRYNVLQEDPDGKIGIPDPVIDDAQKGAHYFFCKDDLSVYKRVITNIGVGQYPPPALKCSSK